MLDIKKKLQTSSVHYASDEDVVDYQTVVLRSLYSLPYTSQGNKYSPRAMENYEWTKRCVEITGGKYRLMTDHRLYGLLHTNSVAANTPSHPSVLFIGDVITMTSPRCATLLASVSAKMLTRCASARKIVLTFYQLVFKMARFVTWEANKCMVKIINTINSTHFTSSEHAMEIPEQTIQQISHSHL